jgi:hypothetical protein
MRLRTNRLPPDHKFRICQVGVSDVIGAVRQGDIDKGRIPCCGTALETQVAAHSADHVHVTAVFAGKHNIHRMVSMDLSNFSCLVTAVLSICVDMKE